jgi:hypothetical protein
LLKWGVDDSVYLRRENAHDHLRVVAEPHSRIRGPDAPDVFDERLAVTRP